MPRPSRRRVVVQPSIPVTAQERAVVAGPVPWSQVGQGIARPVVITEPLIETPRREAVFLPDVRSYLIRRGTRDLHTYFGGLLFGALCRAVYYEFNPLTYSKALTEFFGVTSFERLTDEGNPAIAVDLWSFGDDLVVAAFRGTSSLTQAMQYLTEKSIQVEDVNYPPYVTVWKGLKQQVDDYILLVARWLQARMDANRLPPILQFTGHSLGGTAAYATALWLNSPHIPNYVPVWGVTTFGEAEYFHIDRSPSPDPSNDFSMHPGFFHRQYQRPGDPVVYAASAAAAVNRGKVPMHFGTDMDTLDGGSPSPPLWTLLDDREATSAREAKALAPLAADEAETWISQAIALVGGQNHLMHNYTLRLESICRRSGYTPYPLFTRLVKALRFLDDLVPDA